MNAEERFKRKELNLMKETELHKLAVEKANASAAKWKEAGMNDNARLKALQASLGSTKPTN